MRRALIVVIAIAGCGGRAAVGAADAGGGRGASDGAVAQDVADASAAATLGCDGTKRPAVDGDPGVRGPLAVGARTAMIEGMRVEVWYPARPQANAAACVYDVREVLDAEAAARVGEAGRVEAACARDLEIDPGYGPYPVVFFFHGLTLFRFESAWLATHWASRGFVVIAPDMPGATLGDVIGGRRKSPTEAVKKMVASALRGDGGLAFLRGHIDGERLGLTGHSLGADVAAEIAREQGDVVLAMAERGVPGTRGTVTTWVIGGMGDRVEPYVRQRRGYQRTPAPKHLVGLRGVGHMSFTEVCAKEARGGGLFAELVARGVHMDGFLGKLAADGCEAQVAPADARLTIARVTTAALEEALMCVPGTSVLDQWQGPGGAIGELEYEAR